MKPQVPFLVRRGERRAGVRTAQSRRRTRRPADVPSCRAITTMHSTRDAGLAGFMIVSTAVLCAAAGAGIGALVGAPLALAVVGVFVGFGLGFRLVYTRFRDV